MRLLGETANAMFTTTAAVSKLRPSYAVPGHDASGLSPACAESAHVYIKLLGPSAAKGPGEVARTPKDRSPGIFDSTRDPEFHAKVDNRGAHGRGAIAHLNTLTVRLAEVGQSHRERV